MRQARKEQSSAVDTAALSGAADAAGYHSEWTGDPDTIRLNQEFEFSSLCTDVQPGASASARGFVEQRDVFRGPVHVTGPKITKMRCFVFQTMIDLSLSTPIQDASVFQFPLDLVSQLLQEVRTYTLDIRAQSHFFALVLWHQRGRNGESAHRRLQYCSYSW